MTFISRSGRILNYPIDVYFAGFKSNTLEMQSNGWELAMHQEPMGRSICLAAFFPKAKIYMMSSVVEYHFIREFQLSSGFIPPQLEFHINYISSKLETLIVPRIDFRSFDAIDATPQYQSMQTQSIEDFKIFRPLDKTKDIIVDPKDVNALMELILKAQDPKQKEIRHRDRKKEDYERMQAEPSKFIHAQLISLCG